MKSITTILFLLALAYGLFVVNEKYLKPRTSTLASASSDSQATASAPVSAPAPAPQVQPDPSPVAPEPVSVPPAVVAALAPAADSPTSAPEQPAGPVTIVTQTSVQAFDPNSPLTPLGWFKAGTLLEVSECATTGMKGVSFKDPSGKVIHAVCFEKDLNRTADEEVVASAPSQPKPVVEKPKPLTFKPKKWAGEPNWHSIYDDSGYNMMTDKEGNQK